MNDRFLNPKEAPCGSQELQNNRCFKMLTDYPDVLDINQVCEILRVSTKTGYALLHSGKIGSLKVGRAYRIPKVKLLEYLK